MKLLRLICLITCLCFSTASVAATVSFGLNQNDVGFDPSIDYATVTLSNNSVDAAKIDFQVDLHRQHFNDSANLGVQAFYFNSAIDISGVSLSGLPGWRLDLDFDQGIATTNEFGAFDVEYKSIWYTAADPLRFTLSHDGDSLLNYALNNAQDFAFAAKITGYDNGLGGTSGWFGASSVAQTPLPAAVWLFGTALAGLIGIARRRALPPSSA